MLELKNITKTFGNVVAHNALIPPDVIQKVEEAKAKIGSGEIKVTDAMAK